MTTKKTVVTSQILTAIGFWNKWDGYARLDIHQVLRGKPGDFSWGGVVGRRWYSLVVRYYWLTVLSSRWRNGTRSNVGMNENVILSFRICCSLYRREDFEGQDSRAGSLGMELTALMYKGDTVGEVSTMPVLLKKGLCLWDLRTDLQIHRISNPLDLILQLTTCMRIAKRHISRYI